ncbi:hypothetical protein TPA0907_22680 [Micromonospora humidisoli]|nr:hypothetical protein TPA0907_22680 [Micromonospora sp. AKA109]
MGGEEGGDLGGRVATVGDVPQVAVPFDEHAAAALRYGGYVDGGRWERFHAGWLILPHPFSGFPGNMAEACSIRRAVPWYCASLVM